VHSAAQQKKKWLKQACWPARSASAFAMDGARRRFPSDGHEHESEPQRWVGDESWLNGQKW